MSEPTSENDSKKVVTAAFLSALLVLGVALPAGYFGLTLLPQQSGSVSEEEIRSVIIDLQAETIAEVAVYADQTRTEISELRSENTTALQGLTSEIEALRAEQVRLNESLAAMEEAARAVAEAQAPVAAGIPGQRQDTFNRTVFFELGEIAGQGVELQINAAVSDIQRHADGQSCTSDVLGFSDTFGGDRSNLALSQKRAEHVAAKLRDAGLSVATVQGWGERWLLEHTVDGIKNQVNRRVVIETTCDGHTSSASPVPVAGS